MTALPWISGNLITFHMQMDTQGVVSGCIHSFRWCFCAVPCVRHCARGCRADRKGRSASPGPTLFGERLGCAEQNTELTPKDRIVEIIGRTSYENIKWSMISFQSCLPAFSPLSQRLGARWEGFLRSTLQLRSLMMGSSLRLSFP